MPTQILVSPRAVPKIGLPTRLIGQAGLLVAILALCGLVVYVDALYPDAFATIAEVAGP